VVQLENLTVLKNESAENIYMDHNKGLHQRANTKSRDNFSRSSIIHSLPSGYLNALAPSQPTQAIFLIPRWN